MSLSDSPIKPDLPHGALTRIARRLRPPVSVQHVREVYLGRRSSRRVEKAIAAYTRSLTTKESAA